MRTQHDIDESRRAIFERDGWKCQFPGCYAPATEIAHHIGQGERHIRATKLSWNGEYNESRNYNWIRQHVTHHPLNVSASCRKHNDYFNIGNNPGAVRDKLAAIRDNLIEKGVI